MSSCYLLDSPKDSLDAIYDAYKQIALLSKFSGGIGLAFHRIRSEGSLIRATNGLSNGIVPWLRTLESAIPPRSEEHTSELQSHLNLVCRLLLEKKKNGQYLMHQNMR